MNAVSNTNITLLSNLRGSYKHGTIIRTAYRTQLTGGLLLEMLKYFKVMLNIFVFSHVKEVVES